MGRYALCLHIFQSLVTLSTIGAPKGRRVVPRNQDGGNANYNDGWVQKPGGNQTSGTPPLEPGFRQRLSAFLEWSKPYRDIIAISITLIAATSGGVAWLVAHFATQAELSYLECRITHELADQAHDNEIKAFAIQIEARNAVLKELALQKPPISGPPAKQLADEVSELTKEETFSSNEYKKTSADIIKKCESDSPASTNSRGRQ